MTVAHGHPWAVWGRTFALMSITHPFGSDVKSMSEFYNKRFLRAVTLLLCILHSSFFIHPRSVFAVPNVVDVVHAGVDRGVEAGFSREDAF